MVTFKAAKFQSSVFTPDLSISNSLRFLNAVAELLGDRVGKNPHVLPIPQDAPSDIPRIQFSSPDTKWRVNISLARTDLIYLSPTISEETKVGIGEFSATSCGFFPKYQETLDLRIQRLAFVTERFLPHENATRSIINRFCKQEQCEKGRSFHNAKKFEIHSYKRYDWLGFHLNSWVRVKSVDFKPDDQESVVPAIFVVNDLNTLSVLEDQDRKFASEEIYTFFDSVPHELKLILDIYFDEQGDQNGKRIPFKH
jgi:hypothetical protein